MSCCYLCLSFEATDLISFAVLIKKSWLLENFFNLLEVNIELK